MPKKEQETEEAGGHPLCKTPKETEEIEDEESGLEEDIEEAEQEIEEDKFVEFMTPLIESSSATLNQVAVAPELRATDLEQDLSNVVGFQEEKKDEEKKYETQIIKDYDLVKEMPRSHSEYLVVKQTTPINLERVGKDILRPSFEQKFKINPELQELRSHQVPSRDYVVEARSIEKTENKLPFQQEERKYKGRLI